MIGCSWCGFFFFFQWWWLAENEEIIRRDGLTVLLSSMKAVLMELGSTTKLRLAMELRSVVRWRTGRDGSAAWDGDEDEDRR